MCVFLLFTWLVAIIFLLMSTDLKHCVIFFCYIHCIVDSIESRNKRTHKDGTKMQNFIFLMDNQIYGMTVNVCIVILYCIWLHWEWTPLYGSTKIMSFEGSRTYFIYFLYLITEKWEWQKNVIRVFFSSHPTEILLYVIINNIHHGLNVNTYSSKFPSCWH